MVNTQTREVQFLQYTFLVHLYRIILSDIMIRKIVNFLYHVDLNEYPIEIKVDDLLSGVTR